MAIKKINDCIVRIVPAGDLVITTNKYQPLIISGVEVTCVHRSWDYENYDRQAGIPYTGFFPLAVLLNSDSPTQGVYTTHTTLFCYMSGSFTKTDRPFHFVKSHNHLEAVEVLLVSVN